MAKPISAAGPTRGASKEKLDLDDLRAIPFVGAWSQLKQNVPGYYGLGTAIQALVAEGKTDQLKQLFQWRALFQGLDP
jgi:phosphoenolpyruvate carboxylase